MPDLNLDLGELPDEPSVLYELAHRVNLACGGHAGDEASLRRACALALASGCLVGAHPSFEDRANFGRVPHDLPPPALRALVASQCATLARVAAALGVTVSHVKPHGALYHVAAQHGPAARAVVEGARDALGDVSVVGPPEGGLLEAARALGLPYLREGFADRRYEPYGRLTPRTRPDALLTDPALAAAQALSLAREGRFDTLCVHGDGPHAVAVARAVRAALDGRAP